MDKVQVLGSVVEEASFFKPFHLTIEGDQDKEIDTPRDTDSDDIFKPDAEIVVSPAKSE